MKEYKFICTKVSIYMYIGIINEDYWTNCINIVNLITLDKREP